MDITALLLDYYGVEAAELPSMASALRMGAKFCAQTVSMAQRALCPDPRCHSLNVEVTAESVSFREGQLRCAYNLPNGSFANLLFSSCRFVIERWCESFFFIFFFSFLGQGLCGGELFSLKNGKAVPLTSVYVPSVLDQLACLLQNDLFYTHLKFEEQYRARADSPPSVFQCASWTAMHDEQTTPPAWTGKSLNLQL